MDFPRNQILTSLLDVARADERILGVIDYGSGGQGRADEWSDIDLVFVARNESADDFQRNWRTWIARFGELLLAYPGITGTPCAVFSTPWLPVRLDCTFYGEAKALVEIPKWEVKPARVEEMLLLDRSGGRLRACIEGLLQNESAAVDIAHAFERTAGDFWYFTLRAAACLARGQLWAERHNHQIIMDRLAGLVRLRTGTLKDWQKRPIFGLERDVPAEYLDALPDCFRLETAQEIAASLRASARLAATLCAEIAAMHQLDWPERLAAEVASLLGKLDTGRAGG